MKASVWKPNRARLAVVLVTGVLASACALTGDSAGGERAQARPSVAYKYAQVEGRKIFYREAGRRSDPTIVLLHGFPSSSHMYRELIPLLADRFHVVAPDYIGFGHSDAPPATEFRYTFDNLAKAMVGFLNELELREYLLYMQDFGGPVGFRVATAHPERVKGLVIQNANAYAEGLSDAARGFLYPLWKERNEKTLAAFRNLIALDGTRFQYQAGTRNPEGLNPDAWVFDQALLDRPGSAERQLALFIDYENNVALYDDWQAYLRKYQPKTLVVWGKGDPFFTVAGAEAYRRDLKNVEVHLLNTGHFALEEDAPQIAHLIKRTFN